MSTLPSHAADYAISHSLPSRHQDRIAPHSPHHHRHVIELTTRLTDPARKRLEIIVVESYVNTHLARRYPDTTTAADYPPSSASARSTSARMYPIA